MIQKYIIKLKKKKAELHQQDLFMFFGGFFVLSLLNVVGRMNGDWNSITTGLIFSLDK